MLFAMLSDDLHISTTPTYKSYHSPASLTASLSLTIITPVLLSLPCHRVDITVQISQQISVQILSTALPRVPVWMWPAPRQSAHWTAALLTTLRRPPGPGRPPPYSHQAIEYRVVQSSLQTRRYQAVDLNMAGDTNPGQLTVSLHPQYTGLILAVIFFLSLPYSFFFLLIFTIKLPQNPHFSTNQILSKNCLTPAPAVLMILDC